MTVVNRSVCCAERAIAIVLLERTVLYKVIEVEDTSTFENL